jgi:hypothetical protein
MLKKLGSNVDIVTTQKRRVLGKIVAIFMYQATVECDPCVACYVQPYEKLKDIMFDKPEDFKEIKTAWIAERELVLLEEELLFAGEALSFITIDITIVENAQLLTRNGHDFLCRYGLEDGILRPLGSVLFYDAHCFS